MPDNTRLHDRIIHCLTKKNSYEVSIVALPNAIFIEQLDQVGLKFLHTLFLSEHGLTRNCALELAHFPLRSEYLSLLDVFNGWSLFSGAFHLYGHCTHNSRSVLKEDRQPISLKQEVQQYRRASCQDGAFFAVGAVVGFNTTFNVVFDPWGYLIVQEGSRNFIIKKRFIEFIFIIIEWLDTVFNDKKTEDDRAFAVDQLFPEFIEKHMV